MLGRGVVFQTKEVFVVNYKGVIIELITTGVPMSKKGELLMIMPEQYGELGLF